MSDLSITATSVAKGAGAKVKHGNTGTAALTAGQPIYIDATTGLAEKSRANAAGTYLADGVALHASSPGQPIAYAAKAPAFIPGATLVKGVTYVVSAAAAGGIAPQADLTTGNFVCVLGVATSASVLNLDLTNRQSATAIA